MSIKHFQWLGITLVNKNATMRVEEWSTEIILLVVISKLPSSDDEVTYFLRKIKAQRRATFTYYMRMSC